MNALLNLSAGLTKEELSNKLFMPFWNGLFQGEGKRRMTMQIKDSRGAIFYRCLLFFS
jgi:hypothetical protein